MSGGGGVSRAGGGESASGGRAEAAEACSACARESGRRWREGGGEVEPA